MASNSTEKCSGSEITSKVHQLVNALIAYCRSKKEKITQKTALIVVKVILLNPKWKHISKEDISDQEVHSFIEVCFHFLFDEKSLSSTTIKMLIFFYGRYLSRDQYKEHQNQVMMKNCFHLLQKLKKVWHNPTEDFKDMHYDLIQLALIKVGMNNKEDCTAFEEMKTAGIRLHAWYSDKAGRFMFDVGKIMKVTLPKVCEDLHDELSDVRKHVEKLQSLLKEKVIKDFPNSDIQFHHEKRLLINAVNYFEFLKILKKDIEERNSYTDLQA
ncbi:uncharacterized protein LOC118188061 isoform X2 [Stegodyphus dumicola]|uniref:uncharacterized protein LOC118188061 isoform X2 n=1 Tax=Stegodyphus dumicola TaxID=202533 RepID=UPI0015AE0290|nr:uncharacterized protein LOC118188061 isoform X2 [Stegodyphus dumicola]